jgi:hypothetical protein
LPSISLRNGTCSRGSIRQVEILAPPVGADVPRHDLARSRRPKQTASCAVETALWAILIFGVALRHLLLR